MKKKFNMFQVLSKDDKELVHSAFLAWLVSLNSPKIPVLLTLFNLDICSSIEDQDIIIEYSLGSRKKIDLKFDFKDTIIFIENKFKSMPDKEQLVNYSNLIQTNCGRKKIIKILICFDDKTVPSDVKDWLVFTYAKLLNKIVKMQDFIKGDENTFIQHYVNFLKTEYLDMYYKIMTNPSEIISKLKDKKTKQERSFSAYLTSNRQLITT